jgi:hypothetical protein
MPRRTLRILILVATLALAAVMVVLVIDDGTQSVACNGSEHLCDRPLDDVSFAATHNSMSAADQPGWRFTQQERGIGPQLDAGMRGLLIDMYYGVQTSRGVQNVPLNKVTDRARPVGIGRDVYLCHTVCGFGATRATDALGDVRDFLAGHPREVLLISIEDQVRPRDVARVFERSGLDRYVWRGSLGPRRFPTLREMIERDERVVAMTENNSRGVPWLRDQFDLFQETPYRFATTAEVAAQSSCRPNRGNARNPLFLLNNWVDTSPLPRPSNAAAVNARATLLRRARMCQRLRERLPNLVAVDFSEQGDVFGVVAELNR